MNFVGERAKTCHVRSIFSLDVLGHSFPLLYKTLPVSINYFIYVLNDLRVGEPLIFGSVASLSLCIRSYFNKP